MNDRKPINFCRSKQECALLDEKERQEKKAGTLRATNPRYKNFFQSHFTAGDPNHFNQLRNMEPMDLCFHEIKQTNDFFDEKNKTWEWKKYKDIPAEAVDNTFNYIYYKFKKGLFMQIRNNEQKVFLPFSNASFYNEWGHKIKVDPSKYKSFEEMYSHVQKASGFNANLKHINRNPHAWYSNNCLVRFEHPFNEGDNNVAIINDMFETLLKERKVNDMELFINRRDFPLLKLNETEAYEEMFDSDNLPLLSHKYDKYCPILSMVTTREFADLPIPTYDDWSRVCRKEGKFFQDNYKRDYEMDCGLNWNDKKDTAVFRGTNTGCGTTVNTNPRLKAGLLMISEENIKNKYIDAGLTKWNTRLRKCKGQKYLQFPNPAEMGFDLVQPLTPLEQSKFKYILHLPGHVEAFRLSLELESKSCVLLADCKYKLWYSHLLKPYEHYVPVKADLSDLFDVVQWCRANDKHCERIARNAYNFAVYYLSKKSILNYLEQLLYNLKKMNGIYIYSSMSIDTTVKQLEQNKVNKMSFQVSNKPINNLLFMTRTFGPLKAFQYILHSELVKKTEFPVLEIISSKKTSITKIDVHGYPVIKKEDFRNSLLHEFFIGNFGINNLAKQIPNFIFSYYNQSNTVIYLEYIKGQTLSKYLLDNNFNMDVFIIILIQVALALQVAQNELLFVHYDLSPGNIVLSEIPRPVSFEYRMNDKTAYSINTSLVPVIIDFEHSIAVIDGIKYTHLDVLKFSSIVDMYRLISLCIKDLIDVRRLNQGEISKLLYLANFLTGTKFRKEPFRTITDLKNFFGIRKYSAFVYDDRMDLEEKTPFDFVKYILGNKYSFNFDLFSFKMEQKDKVKNNFNLLGSNPLQLYEFAYADSKEAQINTCINFFEKLNKTNIETKDPIGIAYIGTIFKHSAFQVYNWFESFIKSIDGSQGDIVFVRELYEQTIANLNKKYKIEPSKINLIGKGLSQDLSPVKKQDRNYIYANVFDVIKYNNSLFSDNTLVKKFIKATENYSPILENISMLTDIANISEIFGDTYRHLFSIVNNLKLKDEISTLITIHKFSKLIYAHDLKVLKIKPGETMCSTAVEYLNNCKAILEERN